MNRSDDLLFYKYDLRGTLDNAKRQMIDSIDAIEPNKLLNTNIDDWVKHFNEEYHMNTPEIDEKAIAIDQCEAKIDVSHDSNRIIHDRSQPFLITGTRIIFYVPFKGDVNCFYCKPSTSNFNPPRAEVTHNEIIMSFDSTSHNGDQVKKQFESKLASIKEYLKWIKSDVDSFNATLPGIISGRIQQRREKLLADQGMAASIGFPIKRREDATRTYIVPTVKKKIYASPQAKSESPFTPEPALDSKEYENILQIISNMALVLERSPKTFENMKEEDIRNHFLVQLNGQYEGQATGETFNAQGKTDILLRINGKNIFIAECKFWKGPKTINDTIDQLLGYLSWRDSKAAIILFNRNKNTSDILSNIPNIAKSHLHFIREVNDYKHESGFRYIFRQKDDPNKEIVLTVIVFDVPKEEKPKE